MRRQDNILHVCDDLLRMQINEGRCEMALGTKINRSLSDRIDILDTIHWNINLLESDDMKRAFTSSQDKVNTLALFQESVPRKSKLRACKVLLGTVLRVPGGRVGCPYCGFRRNIIWTKMLISFPY